MGGGARIRIGDRDPAEALAADHVGPLLGCHVPRIVERVVFIGIAVGPAVDGDGGDIALGIEAAGAEDRHQLLADVALERLERRADRKSTRLNSSHYCAARMPSSA